MINWIEVQGSTCDNPIFVNVLFIKALILSSFINCDITDANGHNPEEYNFSLFIDDEEYFTVETFPTVEHALDWARCSLIEQPKHTPQGSDS